MTIQIYQREQNKRNFAALRDQHWNSLATSNNHCYSHGPSHKTQLDESFEPIAVVTPPKKRAKSDAFAPYNVANVLSDPRSTPQRRNSLLDLINNSHGSLHQMNSANRYGLDSMPLIQSMPSMQSMPSLQHMPSMQSLQPMPCLYNNPMPPLNRAMTSSAFNGISDSALNSLAETKMLGEMEPIFKDQSSSFQNTSSGNGSKNERCPDLCSSSSSLEEGQYIIQASDSLKENGFTKAEVIVGPGENFKLLGMIKNATNGQTRDKTNSSVDATPTTSVTKRKETTTPPLKETPNPSTKKQGSSRFKPFHEEKWSYHFQELRAFKEANGHCLVPHTYPEKPHLARWVKRQRRQYKLRMEGNKNSTMTEERIKILNDIGFVWDSHEVIWNERFSQLLAYKQKCGHCRVPSYCKECPQLASWVKCQRRQYKLYWEEGKGSSMNLDRIKLLNSIGFIWEVHPSRKQKNDDQHFQHLADILMDS